MWSFIEFFKPKYLTYCLLDGFFQGGRLIVGATSVTYLLSQNLSFAQIAQLKSIQAIVFLFLDVPAGIFADSYGRKKSLLVSVITAIFSFFLYFSGAGAFSIFVVAEIFAAVSICFWSGAYEAYTLEKVKLEGHPKQIDQFFHFNQFFSNLFVMLLGYLGGFIGLYGLGYPYLAAIIIFLIILVGLNLLPNDHMSQTNKSRQEAKFNNLKSLFSTDCHYLIAELKNPRLTIFFGVSIGIQFVIQPILHYWQPFFINIHPSAKSTDLSFIFFSYCATSTLFSFLYVKVSEFGYFRTMHSTFFLLSIFSFFYILLPSINNWNLTVILFCLMQGFLGISRTSLSARFIENIAVNKRATMLSLLSFTSRLGMFIALNFVLPMYLNSGQKQFTNQSLGLGQEVSIGGNSVLTKLINTTYFHFATISMGLTALAFAALLFTQKTQNSYLRRNEAENVIQ